MEASALFSGTWKRAKADRNIGQVEASALFSGTWKRAKADRNIRQVTSCLVDGCDTDLKHCGDYHRRHKVCEIHSKTPKVIIGGRDQRFCQQCSRFHSLVEFDEGKRSCRKRLDGHNRRRRKPQVNSISRNSGFISSSQQGTRFYSFGGPQVLASAAIVEPENSTVTYKNQLPSYKAVNQLQFIQGSRPAAIVQETSLYQTFLDSKNTCERSKIFSDHARSLLSSANTLTQVFGLSQAFQTEPILPQTQSFGHNWLYTNDLDPFTLAEEVKPVVAAAESHGGNVSNTINFPEMFQHGSSTNGSNQTLTFL